LTALRELGHCGLPAKLYHIVNTLPIRHPLGGFLATVGGLLVVDNMVGTQLLQRLGLLCGTGSRDHGCASSFCKLYSKDVHASSALCEDYVARNERLQIV
jgi:hypothetical protein